MTREELEKILEDPKKATDLAYPIFVTMDRVKRLFNDNTMLWMLEQGFTSLAFVKRVGDEVTFSIWAYMFNDIDEEYIVISIQELLDMINKRDETINHYFNDIKIKLLSKIDDDMSKHKSEIDKLQEKRDSIINLKIDISKV